jgi:hypothetical protein
MDKYEQLLEVYTLEEILEEMGLFDWEVLQLLEENEHTIPYYLINEE